MDLARSFPCSLSLVHLWKAYFIFLSKARCSLETWRSTWKVPTNLASICKQADTLNERKTQSFWQRAQMRIQPESCGFTNLSVAPYSKVESKFSQGSTP